MQTLKGLRAAGAPPLQPRPGGTVMAQYSFSVKTVSRSAGRSATGAAAYRAGERIEDERTGVVHDYSRKGGVVSARLYAPADAPEWAADRAAMWNAAEQKENRKNSTVAREFLAALPHEMTDTQRAALVDDFARELVDRYGFVLDAAIHRPSAGGDQRNHHAHLLATTRDIGPDGFDKKTRSLDSRQSGEVEHLRERWAEVVNRHLERCQIAERVDHRSLADQGIDRPAQIHQGPAATAMERRGIETDRGDHNRDVAAYVESQIALAKIRAEIDAEVDHARAQAEFEAVQVDELERDEPPADYIERRAAEIAAEREARENREAEQARAADGLEARRQAQARRIVESIQSPGTTAGIAELREQARALRRPKPAPVSERAVREAAEAEALQHHPVTIRQRDGSKRQTSLWALDRQAKAAESEAESLRGQLELDEIQAERDREQRQQRGWFSRMLDRTPDEPPELVEQRREVERAERRAAAARHHYDRIADDLPARPTVSAKLRQAGAEAVEQAHERHGEAVERWEDRQAVADILDGVADRAERHIEADQAKDRQAIAGMKQSAGQGAKREREQDQGMSM